MASGGGHGFCSQRRLDRHVRLAGRHPEPLGEELEVVDERLHRLVDVTGRGVVRTLERVAGMGFRFSLDQVTDLNMDFAALARHRVKYLKIDAGMLLSQIRGTRSDFRELKAELNRFGIDLVAEKVEDEATLVELLDYPISFGQGYLFGEPRLSREDI